MTPLPLSAALRALPHFRLLDAGQLDAIARHARSRTFSAGDALFFERDPASAFFAVQSGGAKLFRLKPDGREQVIHVLGPGQTFAEAAVLSFGFYPVNGVATETPTDLLEISGEPIKQLMRDDERLAASMVGSLSMRLLELVERVEELSSASASVRLARFLTKLPGAGPPTRPTVELPVAKKDLAARLGIAPETLSRVLRKWEDQGLIDSSQRTLVLLNPGKLLALADGEE